MGCINWAWRIQGLPANEKLLLVAIADRADKESGACVAPISRLSRDCSGWTRQQTNRILQRLADQDLLVITQRYAGTDDGSRMFSLNLTVDPLEWRPKPEKARRGRGSIMSTYDFQQLLRAEMKTSQQIIFYENWLHALRPIEVKTGALLCKIPSADFSTKIWEYQDLIVRLAQKHISPAAKKIRFVWYKRPRENHT
jgi:hypothetical protein